MEILFEILFEIIVEGCIEITWSKSKIPLPLRIIAAIVYFLIFFGFGGFLIYIGVSEAFNNNSNSILIAFVGLFIFLVGIYEGIKMINNKI